MCFLSEDIHDYYNVAQGKITIPGVDDAEECLLTDVSPDFEKSRCLVGIFKNPQTFVKFMFLSTLLVRIIWKNYKMIILLKKKKKTFTHGPACSGPENL